MPTRFFWILLCGIGTHTAFAALESHFECKKAGEKSYRPYYMKVNAQGTGYDDFSKTAKGLLGQDPMESEEECKQAVEASNKEHGVICSRTGLGGWKPTLYTGTKPGRADFGYLGGSTIKRFEDCIKATELSSAKGVCYWGGSDWWVSPIDREGTSSGPYRTLADCTDKTKTEKKP